MSASYYLLNEQDLCPLVTPEAYDYRNAQEHAKQVDDHLGFRIDEIEARLIQQSQSDFEAKEKWLGLKPSALQTPYIELRMMIEQLGITSGTVMDLGAGYGRMAVVIGEYYPQLKFIGYEIARERVDEGNRVFASRYPNVKLIQQDLADSAFHLPEADVYFIYDFGTLPSIQKIIREIQAYARKHPVTVVGRGRRVRDEIERHEAWLSQVVPPKHFGNFSFYFSSS